MTESRNNSCVLSICIPTFNRSAQISALVSSIASEKLPIEIVIHIDGSTDDTYERLSNLSRIFDNVVLSRSENKGRAAALKTAINNSCGKFIMIYDDDDEISPGSLSNIIARCLVAVSEGVCGFMFHMSAVDRAVIGDEFTRQEGNFLSVRADQDVKGDKKEVVFSDLLKAAVNQYNYLDRRIPASLYWAWIALSANVICVNEIVGRKNYLKGGMTNTIKKLKRDNPAPMAELYRLRAIGYIRGRYRRRLFFIKSVLAYFYYSIICLFVPKRV